MKLVKSLLLGSAAGVVAVASAQAADLPTKKAAPVEYVRVCDAYGAGFFYIPGTQTCLRIGGFVRAEYTWLNARTVGVPNGAGATLLSSRHLDTTGFRARARMNVDTRTQTSWGTLRTFARFDWTQDTGVYAQANGAATGRSNYFSVRYAFIQWAGITAGSAQSFFDFYADAFNFERVRGSDTQTNLLAYTATFGGGFSATISIEDRNRRISNGLAPIPGGPGAGGVQYAGYRMPDLVANLRVDQGWGSAQLSGALHQLNTIQGIGVGAAKKDTWGYAIQGGVMINLPMLAAGDALYLQAAYAKGAIDYIGVGTNNQGNVSGGYLGRFHGGLLRTDADAFAFAVPGGYILEKTSGWAITAGLKHFWAPNFNQTIYASYMEVSPGSRARRLDWTLGGLGKAKEWTVGTTFTWSPVKDFDIGLDLIYARLNQNLAGGRVGGVGAIVPVTPLPVGLKRNVDTYEARLRLQRAF